MKLLVLVICLQTSVSAAQNITGLVGSWPLNGNYHDVSGYGNTLTVNGVDFSADRKAFPGQACQFNSNDYLMGNESGNFNFGSNNFSISVWIKIGTGSGTIISKQNMNYDGWNLWNQDGKIQMIAGHGPANHNIVSTLKSYNDNNWHHVVAIRVGDNAQDWRIYVDGNLPTLNVLQSSLTNSNLSTDAPMLIGRRNAGDTFIGNIDEVSVFNKVLSPAEVTTLYGVPAPENGLLGRWSFNGNLVDESIGWHSVSLVGANYTDDRYGVVNNALWFDGDDLVSVNNDHAFNFGMSDFSVSAWFKSSMTGLGVIIAKQSSPTLRSGWNLCLNNGKVMFYFGHGAQENIIESATLVNDDQWHHVVAIRKGNTAANSKLYIDGIEGSIVQAALLENGDLSISEPLLIGRRGGGNTFQGKLDDISVYNRALTMTEIIDLKQSTSFLYENCSQIYCDEDGVGIGTTTIPAGYRMAVQGKIIAEGVKVDLHTNWPDYVFDKDYPLMSLADMKQYIEKEGHLPDVPSAKEVQANGIDLGEMNAILLKKIEENTLLLIELGERLHLMEIENQKLKSKKRNR